MPGRCYCCEYPGRPAQHLMPARSGAATAADVVCMQGVRLSLFNLLLKLALPAPWQTPLLLLCLYCHSGPNGTMSTWQYRLLVVAPLHSLPAEPMCTPSAPHSGCSSRLFQRGRCWDGRTFQGTCTATSTMLMRPTNRTSCMGWVHYWQQDHTSLLGLTFGGLVG